jgi:hypothetical protein
MHLRTDAYVDKMLSAALYNCLGNVVIARNAFQASLILGRVNNLGFGFWSRVNCALPRATILHVLAERK